MRSFLLVLSLFVCQSALATPKDAFGPDRAIVVKSLVGQLVKQGIATHRNHRTHFGELLRRGVAGTSPGMIAELKRITSRPGGFKIAGNEQHMEIRAVDAASGIVFKAPNAFDGGARAFRKDGNNAWRDDVRPVASTFEKTSFAP